MLEEECSGADGSYSQKTPSNEDSKALRSSLWMPNGRTAKDPGEAALDKLHYREVSGLRGHVRLESTDSAQLKAKEGVRRQKEATRKGGGDMHIVPSMSFTVKLKHVGDHVNTLSVAMTNYRVQECEMVYGDRWNELLGFEENDHLQGRSTCRSLLLR